MKTRVVKAHNQLFLIHLYQM